MASYIDECLWAIRFGTPPPAAPILMLARSENYLLVAIAIR
jgi:hypothetical protein